MKDHKEIHQQTNKSSNKYKSQANHYKKEENANHHIRMMVIVYLIIMVYLLVLVVVSFTKEDIDYLYVEPGRIFVETSYQGLIIRDEKLVYSLEQGEVNYFVPEGSKVRQNTYVCAVNQDELVREKLNDEIYQNTLLYEDSMEFTAEDYELLRLKIKDYVISKENRPFEYTYFAKENLLKSAREISQTAYIKDKQLFEKVQSRIQELESTQLENGSYYRMDESGIISYTFDGFENVHIDTFQVSDLYREVNSTIRNSSSLVEINDPLYKVVNNHLFYVVAQIDPRCNSFLAEKDYITLYFPTKNIEIDVRKERLFEENANTYVVFEVPRYFDEFFLDRFIEFKITFADYDGIKIPNDSILVKPVFKVPKTAVIEYKSSQAVQLVIPNVKNPTHNEISKIAIKVYDTDEEFAYINTINPKETLSEGDVIKYSTNVSEGDLELLEDFQLEKATELEGVYVINKGFTDFKKINIIYEDENFTVVENGIGYSIKIYDKVVANAGSLDEFVTYQ